MTSGEHLRMNAHDGRAWRIENLPDELAAELEAGLDSLWSADTPPPAIGDTIIG